VYITNKLDLFRGLIILIKRRIVKVRRGRLYTDFKKRIKIRVASVSLILKDILYVPSLSINLFLSRKLCLE
jgi:hypothetical protein